MIIFRKINNGAFSPTVSLFASEDVDPQLTCLTAPPRVGQHLSPQVSESGAAAADLVDLDSSRTSSVIGAEPSRWRSSCRESGAAE